MRLLKLLAASVLASEAHFLRKDEAKKTACQTGVAAICLTFSDGTDKALKEGSKPGKTDQCKVFNDNCTSNESFTNPDAKLPLQAQCAAKEDTASYRQAYDVVKEFCGGSCR